MNKTFRRIENVVPVILAGGSGTRLWPMSRGTMPKQFLKLDGKRSLLQDTVARSLECFVERPWIITTDSVRFLVDQELSELGVGGVRLLLEPAGRDTAAATFLVALAALKHAPGQMVFVQPSDHLIPDHEGFAKAVGKAARVAAGGSIVTIGLTPSAPETGFGYIETGAPLGEEGAYRTASFREKPSLEVAETYLAGGKHLWNAGMFMFDPAMMVEEAENHVPEIIEPTRQAYGALVEEGGLVEMPSALAYGRIPALSLDYAIMERTGDSAVVKADFEWSDVGSWEAVWEALPKDEAGNVTNENTLLSNTKNAYVHSSGPMVVASDVEDIAIIADTDAVLVTSRRASQDIKSLLALLKAGGHDNLVREHKTVYRPWGGYTSLALFDRFQVKRLFVKPGKRLSLQKHFHRSEHWVVVTGTAEVTINDEVRLVQENESVYINSGDVHRLANPGRIMLEVIEVQTGSYLGEDDIVRLQDDFKRAPVER